MYSNKTETLRSGHLKKLTHDSQLFVLLGRKWNMERGKKFSTKKCNAFYWMFKLFSGLYM